MTTRNGAALTPRQIVAELDRYIIGQDQAKRAVAIALRNRWRRQQIEGELRDEVTPKNILLIGPTGVGKTEIARRLARLARAPFLKVEATKFTEVGYVGRDVESIVRDLVEAAVKMVREERRAEVEEEARRMAEERLLDALEAQRQNLGGAGWSREDLRRLLRQGAFEDREVELELHNRPAVPFLEVAIQGGEAGMDGGLKDLFEQFMPRRSDRLHIPVRDARRALVDEEVDKRLDMEAIAREAVGRAERDGIVFIDEIDKIAAPGSRVHGPDVSREGVQRDILPLVEGTAVKTRHGTVRTDHMLFVGAGAFHVAKPGDLIPELQGRFPIRVELDPLTEHDFVRILQEPQNSLVRQYTAMLATEEVTLEFTPEAIEAIARTAARANELMEDIGARRLHTVMEWVLEDISFEAPECRGARVVVDAAMVEQRVARVMEDPEHQRFIL